MEAKIMVEFRNIKFTVPDVVKIGLNLIGFVVFVVTMNVKMSVLIEEVKGMKIENTQKHKEQDADIKNLQITEATQGTRITILENKKQ